jgi:hypothetical protein
MQMNRLKKSHNRNESEEQTAFKNGRNPFIQYILTLNPITQKEDSFLKKSLKIMWFSVVFENRLRSPGNDLGLLSHPHKY